MLARNVVPLFRAHYYNIIFATYYFHLIITHPKKNNNNVTATFTFQEVAKIQKVFDIFYEFYFKFRCEKVCNYVGCLTKTY